MFESVDFNKLEKAILSNPKKDSIYKKATVKKIIIKDSVMLQLEYFTKTQAFQKNYDSSNIGAALLEMMNEFIQAEIWCSDYYYAFKVTSKGKVLSNKKSLKTTINAITHNKEKNYIIKEGMKVPALIDLGVMTPDGKVVKAYFDKYRQINNFLEILDKTIGHETELNVIDFGCGKSYLTFIVYYYLVYIKNIKANIIGLDLKKDVIDQCNKISQKYGYNDLKFCVGDVGLYKPTSKIDMVITLHACDTATDYAMYHAISYNAKYILSVPCCQKEINKQLSNDIIPTMNKYGLLKERFSSLLTDSIRANILEYYGYKVNVGEFIDYDGSPKNVLIKAVKISDEKNLKIKKELDDMIQEYHINQTLYDLVFNKGE